MSTPKQKRYRIRPCGGNRKAWCLVLLRDDGSEFESFGSYTTALSVDTLLKRSLSDARGGYLTPKPGDQLELIPMNEH